MISRRDLVLGTTALMPAVATASPGKPKLPPGRDPGGVAVAVIGAGVDYTDPKMAARLARDGEGELIGWDFVDKDNRPFRRPDEGGQKAEDAAGMDAVMRLLSSSAALRLIPVRVPKYSAVALGQALAFVAMTPAKVAIVLASGERGGRWSLFYEAGEATRQRLLIIYPEARILENPPPLIDPILGLGNLVVAIGLVPGGLITSEQKAGVGAIVSAAMMPKAVEAQTLLAGEHVRRDFDDWAAFRFVELAVDLALYEPDLAATDLRARLMQQPGVMRITRTP